MCIALSALFGCEGRYNLCGVDVHFDKEDPGFNVFGDSCFSKITGCLLRNPVVKLATFGYLHVFIHEMGHALASKLCGSDRPHVEIFTSTCQGKASGGNDSLFITLAGPILSTLWEITKLIGAIALIVLVPTPVGLGFGIFLATGSAFWIIGEMAYACSRNGDWSFLR